jgi:hypothetical protein
MYSRSLSTAAEPIAAGRVRFNCENNFATAVGLESNYSMVFPPCVVVVRGFVVPVERINTLAFFSFSLTSIVIPRCVQKIGSKCFSHCFALSSISFESDSQLKSIESEAFSFSSLISIVIPRFVQKIGSKCFYGCQPFSSISFESDSQLKSIESEAFLRTSIASVLAPSQVSFIAGDAFPATCGLLLSGDCCPEFCEWDSLRRRGSCSDFRHPQESRSRLSAE